MDFIKNFEASRYKTKEVWDQSKSWDIIRQYLSFNF